MLKFIHNRSAAVVLAGAMSLVLLLAACSTSTQQTTPNTTASAATTPPDQPPASTTPAPVTSLKLLKASPDKGSSGTTFTLTGTGLKPGAEVDIQWATQVGSYQTEASITNVAFNDYTFKPKQITLRHTTIDANGGLSVQLTAPQDIGGAHDIYIVSGGQELAKGGFTVLRTATLTPPQGPVGTPITVTIHSLGHTAFDNTATVRYDNAYTGEVTGITTKGAAVFQIRAAGAPGPHVININDGGHSTPYLNLGQSPYADQPWDYTFTFTVTDDSAMPDNMLDFPAAGAVAQPPVLAVTTADNMSSGATATLEPAGGAVLSHASLSAQGLPANTHVDLMWVTVRGNRSARNGWDLLNKKVG